MRRANGGPGALDDTLATINAAANAIADSENRSPPATVQEKRVYGVYSWRQDIELNNGHQFVCPFCLEERRWGGFWSSYWCFGSLKHRKRIGHAVLVPETSPENNIPAAENPIQAPTLTLPFVAPPSSPASFLQSDPPSATQSPTGLLSVTSISANMYSPIGPASIFSIGPYAHETQLVTPPVFSTFTTEPSTAPFTPPPESVHLTTPSSPEVPFAQLLEPKIRNGESGQQYPFPHNFQSYQLYPGSPVSNLISPSSGISGSGPSSPFPDWDFSAGGIHFLKCPTGDPPKLLILDKLSSHDWGSRQGSGSLTPDAVSSKSNDGFPLNPQNSEVKPDRIIQGGEGNAEDVINEGQNDEISIDHRFSFRLTPEDVLRCVEKKPLGLTKAILAPLEDAELDQKGENGKIPICHEGLVGQTSNDTTKKTSGNCEGAQLHQKSLSDTLDSAKELNFNHADGGDSLNKLIKSDCYTDDKVVEKEDSTTRNWSFFPMTQPGLSQRV